ncbi:MAG: hypothetical protein ACLQAT_28865 [Candidatus Binataceae bacterium]
MKLTTVTQTLALAAIILTAATSAAAAGEPRPWLCRDKPAFSDGHPMRYQVASKSGSSWQIFFMQFEMNGPHDGYSIIQSRQVTSAPQTGTLRTGQYSAVAMFRKGGVWICGYAQESARPHGAITSLCYAAESDSDCAVTLSVNPDQAAAQ